MAIKSAENPLLANLLETLRDSDYSPSDQWFVDVLREHSLEETCGLFRDTLSLFREAVDDDHSRVLSRGVSALPAFVLREETRLLGVTVGALAHWLDESGVGVNMAIRSDTVDSAKLVNPQLEWLFSGGYLRDSYDGYYRVSTQSTQNDESEKYRPRIGFSGTRGALSLRNNVRGHLINFDVRDVYLTGFYFPNRPETLP